MSLSRAELWYQWALREEGEPLLRRGLLRREPSSSDEDDDPGGESGGERETDFRLPRLGVERLWWRGGGVP